MNASDWASLIFIAVITGLALLAIVGRKAKRR